MFPIPHRHTYYLIGFIATLLAFGFASNSFNAVFLGFAVMLFLCVMYYLTIPLGRLVRNQKIEFVWSIASAQNQQKHHRKKPILIECQLRYWGKKHVVISDLESFISPQVETSALPTSIKLPPKSNNRFRFETYPTHAGRVVFHGISFFLNGPFGLFRVPLYFPTLMTFKVYPNPDFSKPITLPSHHPNIHPRLCALGNDEQLDSSELRPFQSGDAFRQIDWKTSARTGKWYVKDRLPLPSTHYWIVLDVGPSMRAGKFGERKIDRAMDTVASIARQMNHLDKPLGLILVDGEIIYQVDPSTGSLQEMKILNTLIRSLSEIQKGLTQVSERQVQWLVVQYFRNQFAIDLTKNASLKTRIFTAMRSLFRRNKTTDFSFSKGGLQKQIRLRLPAALIESNISTSLPRLFCRYYGIELPYRKFQSSMQKDKGIASALQAIHSESTFFSYIFLITDFRNVSQKWRTLKMTSSFSNHLQIECVPIFESADVEPVDTEINKFNISLSSNTYEQRRLESNERALRTLIRAQLKIRKENIL